MKIKAIKKPKALKLPKMPKDSASNEVKERYLSKVSELKKKKESEWADYHKKVKQAETERKKAQELSKKIKATRGLGATIKTGGRKK